MEKGQSSGLSVTAWTRFLASVAAVLLALPCAGAEDNLIHVVIVQPRVFNTEELEHILSAPATETWIYETEFGIDYSPDQAVSGLAMPLGPAPPDQRLPDPNRMLGVSIEVLKRAVKRAGEISPPPRVRYTVAIKNFLYKGKPLRNEIEDSCLRFEIDSVDGFRHQARDLGIELDGPHFVLPERSDLSPAQVRATAIALGLLQDQPIAATVRSPACGEQGAQQSGTAISLKPLRSLAANCDARDPSPPFDTEELCRASVASLSTPSQPLSPPPTPNSSPTSPAQAPAPTSSSVPSATPMPPPAITSSAPPTPRASTPPPTPNSSPMLPAQTSAPTSSSVPSATPTPSPATSSSPPSTPMASMPKSQPPAAVPRLPGSAAPSLAGTHEARDRVIFVARTIEAQSNGRTPLDIRVSPEPGTAAAVRLVPAGRSAPLGREVLSRPNLFVAHQERRAGPHDIVVLLHPSEPGSCGPGLVLRAAVLLAGSKLAKPGNAMVGGIVTRCDRPIVLTIDRVVL